MCPLIRFMFYLIWNSVDTQHCSQEVAGDQFRFKAIANICLVLSNKDVLRTRKIELHFHEYL